MNFFNFPECSHTRSPIVRCAGLNAYTIIDPSNLSKLGSNTRHVFWKGFYFQPNTLRLSYAD